MTYSILKPAMSAHTHKLIMIPGFLSEKPLNQSWIKQYTHRVHTLHSFPSNHTSSHATYSQQDQQQQKTIDQLWDELDPFSTFDARGWQKLLETFITERQLDLSVEVFQWPSYSVLTLLFEQIKSLLKQWKDVTDIRQLPKNIILQSTKDIQAVWTQAYQAAIDNSASLTAQCAHDLAQGYTLYIIGHSLGGTMLLNAAQQWSQQGLDTSKIYASAWAPALARKDMEYQNLLRLHHPVEIISSHYDLVLKYLFILGQSTQLSGIALLDIPQIILTLLSKQLDNKAVGCVGVDDLYQSHHINLSHLMMRHLDYLPRLPQVWSASKVLPSLMTHKP